ncbi:MORN repeat [Novymonas esmeraldas]|uniref:MORN repeat n=1 Tax=Novymonas esmeraldas TaxID=1808958 RepID=A0AAW0EYD1_9TRYP
MANEPAAFDDGATNFRGGRLSQDLTGVADVSRRTGVGYLHYANGVVYEGEWLNGERHGLGVCFYPSGNIFVGQFRAGLMDGEGTMFFATGECFSGEFRRSTIYKGVYSSRGREICGTWRDGRRVAEMPNKAPEMLQRARAALFSTIVEQVHEYLRGAAANPTCLELPTSPDGAALRPPLDILSSGADAQDVLTTAAPRLSPAPVLDVANQSFASIRLRAASSVADGDAKDSAHGGAAQYGSADAVFACAAPAPNEVFSSGRFVHRCFVFLFPFLSLPWVPLAPLRITSLREEREFVVSGAALRSDFDAPSFILYAVAVAMLFQVTSIVLVACRVPLGRVQDGRLTLPDMVVPCVLWLVVALVAASYTSFFRHPHGLERVDRRLTPRLSAFAASLVDAKASVCIFTYDDDGRGKVMNRHYRYRWLLFGVLVGAMLSLSAPATRGGYGHDMFGADGFTQAAALLAFFATFLFATTLTFLVLKITDMQREIRAKLHVLTDLAFLDRRCLMNPSKHAHAAFDLDDSFDARNLFSGFPGWYSVRSLILYASACANHGARTTAMGVFWFALICAFVVGLGDTLYAVGTPLDRTDQRYSTAHSYAFIVFVAWGPLLQRYLYVCVSTRRALQRHLYIMDIAGLYHRVRLNDSEASDIIQQCRRLSEMHDAAPEMFSVALYTFVVMLTVLLHAAAMAAICYQLGNAIYY